MSDPASTVTAVATCLKCDGDGFVLDVNEDEILCSVCSGTGRAAPGPLERLATRITDAATSIRSHADKLRQLSRSPQHSAAGRARFEAQADALDEVVELLRVALRNDIADDEVEDGPPRWRIYRGRMPHVEHERLELPRKPDDATEVQ